MDDKTSRSLVPKGNVFQEAATRVKLIVRLMGDRRVSPLVKLLPVGALAYWVIPDIAPGPVDETFHQSACLAVRRSILGLNAPTMMGGGGSG